MIRIGLLARIIFPLLLISTTSAQNQPHGDDVWVKDIMGSRQELKEYFDRMRKLPETETSYRLLFEAWSKMQPLPYSRDGLPLISPQTLHPDEPTWRNIARWAHSPAHDDIYDLIAKAGEGEKDEDDEVRVKLAFGLPYGEEGLPVEYLDADFIAEDSPIQVLGANGFPYIDDLEDLRVLVFAEAYRRGEEDDVYGSCKLLLDWIRIGRQLADRDFEIEKVYGMWTMIESTKIMRNILYRHQSSMKVDQYREIVDGLNGLFLDRIHFPAGDKRMLLSLVGDTFIHRGGPDTDKFIDAFAKIESSDSPLATFQIARRWRGIAQNHAGYFDTVDAIKRIWGDWEFRWNMIDPYDESIKGPTYFAKLSSADYQSYAIAVFTLGSLENLDHMRKILVYSIGGTEASLGVLAYIEANKKMPLNFVNITPRHINRIPTDPYDDREQRNKRQLQYFVPVRDYPHVGPRELPTPYTVQLHSPSGADPAVQFNDAGKYDDFLIYSKGKNLRNDFLREDDENTGDIMIWPPLEELLRSRGLWP